MIPNFSIVETGIYRGGQPVGEDWPYLQRLGVTQIIKLNEDSEGQDIVLPGMELFKVLISLAQQILTEPDLQALRDAVGFMSINTLIHCEHGQDRTGLLVGLYRVLVQGWSVAQAYAEMRYHGFHPLELGLGKAWDDMTRGMP